MIISKKYVSRFLYFYSLIQIISVGVYVVWTSKKFILAGKGIGVYGIIIYDIAAVTGFILWFVSHILYRTPKIDLLFILTVILISLFINLQPTWWSAPSLIN